MSLNENHNSFTRRDVSKMIGASLTIPFAVSLSARELSPSVRSKWDKAFSQVLHKLLLKS